MKRRTFGVVGFAALLSRVRPASAEAWSPSRPVRLIVPYAPGGGTDIAARLVARALQDSLGQPVLIENRPGGSEMIGTELVARAAPDGHTVGLVTNAVAINPALYPSVPYDAVRDLRFLTTLCTVPFALVVHPSVAATDLRGLIALMRGGPDSFSYASLGPGSVHGLAMEWFKHLSGTRAVAVPYRGVAPAMQAIASGEVQLGFAGLTSAIPQIQAGRLRALAVSPAAGVPAFPEWPPVAAEVPGFDVMTWYGLVVPAGTPAPVAARLTEETVRALASEDLRARFALLGVDPAPAAPDDVARAVADETRMWTRVVALTGARTE